MLSMVPPISEATMFPGCGANGGITSAEGAGAAGGAAAAGVGAGAGLGVLAEEGPEWECQTAYPITQMPQKNTTAAATMIATIMRGFIDSIPLVAPFHGCDLGWLFPPAPARSQPAPGRAPTARRP